MAKVVANISLDYDCWAKHKSLNNNISAICNEALWKALEINTKSKKEALEKRLAALPIVTKEVLETRDSIVSELEVLKSAEEQAREAELRELDRRNSAKKTLEDIDTIISFDQELYNECVKELHKKYVNLRFDYYNNPADAKELLELMQSRIALKKEGQNNESDKSS
jgi:hypothetical protein